MGLYDMRSFDMLDEDVGVSSFCILLQFLRLKSCSADEELKIIVLYVVKLQAEIKFLNMFNDFQWILSSCDVYIQHEPVVSMYIYSYDFNMNIDDVLFL